MSYALEFQKKEAIRFGDIVAMPEMDKELELRIGSLKIDSSADLDEVTSKLSKAFGSRHAEIKAFMKKNMGVEDLAKVQVYLIRGKSGLESLKKAEEMLLKSEINKVAEGRYETD